MRERDQRPTTQKTLRKGQNARTRRVHGNPDMLRSGLCRRKSSEEATPHSKLRDKTSNEEIKRTYRRSTPGSFAAKHEARTHVRWWRNRRPTTRTNHSHMSNLLVLSSKLLLLSEPSRSKDLLALVHVSILINERQFQKCF